MYDILWQFSLFVLSHGVIDFAVTWSQASLNSSGSPSIKTESIIQSTYAALPSLRFTQLAVFKLNIVKCHFRVLGIAVSTLTGLLCPFIRYW